MDDDAGFFFTLLGCIGVVAIAAIIWLPAINDCNERGGELVTNAFNWPVCIAAAPK